MSVVSLTTAARVGQDAAVGSSEKWLCVNNTGQPMNPLRQGTSWKFAFHPGRRRNTKFPPRPPNIESHLQAASALFFFSPLSGDLLFQFFRLFINSCSSTILGEFLPASFDVTIKKSRKSPGSFSMPQTTWNVEGNFYFFWALFTNWNIGARTRSRVGNVRTAPNSICLK